MLPPLYRGSIFFDAVIGMHLALWCGCLFYPSPLFNLSSGRNTGYLYMHSTNIHVTVQPILHISLPRHNIMVDDHTFHRQYRMHSSTSDMFGLDGEVLQTATKANERALKCKPRPHLRNCAHNNVSTIYRIMCHLGVKVNNGFTRLQWRSCSRMHNV